MRVVLCAVNARFSHTNLAVRYLKNALEAAGYEAEICERTINEPVREVLRDLTNRRPDALVFSCYIWNISFIRRVGEQFRLLFPHTPILLGGPEVSFCGDMGEYPFADAVMAGEGEALLPAVLKEKNPRGIRRAEGFVNLDRLPFPYDDLDALQNRVLYYESSRGCPFGCAYCLSSRDRRVRSRSLSLVNADLQRFLDAGVMQVKFVDRTFNLDRERANAVWAYLIGHDNGVTSFQMELGGDLLEADSLHILKRARPGLFQFEIGVQSTYGPALETVCRACDFHKLKANVGAVGAMGNIHQHLDLIAGLPGEGFARFGESFDQVFALRPQQLQLGFLKLLRGSALYDRREELGLLHDPQAPYEILATPQISFAELCRIKTAEEMVETYYNSGRFAAEIDYLLGFEPSAFWFFLSLGESLPKRKVGKYEYFDFLYLFAEGRGADADRLRWLMRYDICRHERPRKLPEHCPPAMSPVKKGLPPGCFAETFPYDVTRPGAPEGPVTLLFPGPAPLESGGNEKRPV